MKTTSLKLEIQQDNVAVGDTVSGIVKVLEPVDPCEGLDIYLEYSGKHVSATRVGRQLLQAGPLERGQSHSFSITIPPQMPFTFEATHHDLQWKVMARADVAWAMDPKVSLPLTVEARRVPDDPEALAEATRVESPPKAPESLVGQVAMWSVVAVRRIGTQSCLKTRREGSVRRVASSTSISERSTISMSNCRPIASSTMSASTQPSLTST